jgi:hypothetical protein
MRRVLLATVLLLAVITASLVGVSNPVSAHQSGCHRWHSCPSDSGSYTCGDTGYYSQCGGSTYVTPTLNYHSQGLTNGKTHADEDLLFIEATAASAGALAGKGNGDIGKYQSTYLSDYPSCKKTFSWDEPQDSLYTSGYESGYESRCKELYAPVYKSSYTSAYTTAKATYDAAEKKKRDDSSAMWTWIIVGGIGVWILWAIIANARK